LCCAVFSHLWEVSEVLYFMSSHVSWHFHCSVEFHHNFLITIWGSFRSLTWTSQPYKTHLADIKILLKIISQH
jgi:hypothetical protein